jgi:outer membrane protein assembly factor BamB
MLLRQRSVLLLAGLALVVGLIAAGCGSDEETGTTAATDSTASPAAQKNLIDWPLFGRVPERTQYMPTERRALDPPLREAWSINTHGLIEFPPAVAGGVAYVVNKFGNLRAVTLRDHRTVWKHLRDPKNRGKSTDVTAPVYSEGRLFIAFLDGELLALEAKTGDRIWKRNLHAHLESSPLVVNGNLYIGTDKKELVSLDAGDGHVRWRFDAPGAIKASPSHHNGRIFVADYEGSMYALDAGTGRALWRTNTTRKAPFGKGGFYSSPAVAFGHVYAARDDGTVYGLDERTGRISWFFQTNNFMYGSPALAQVAGTPPTLYIGSYDDHFYALDARTGIERWKYDVGGPVPGTATVIGHTVYTSSFKTDSTIGIDARTHRKTFEKHQAGYTPVVSDGERLFLVGYYVLVGLEPDRG